MKKVLVVTGALLLLAVVVDACTSAPAAEPTTAESTAAPTAQPTLELTAAPTSTRMAKLAYCKRCNATYPLVIVVSDGARSGKVKEPACPMGHTEVKEVDGVKRLEKVYKFKNFVEAMGFTNRIAIIAEEQVHHPLIITEWGRVTVQWWTHIIEGLHRNDFIMAAKTEEIADRDC